MTDEELLTGLSRRTVILLHYAEEGDLDIYGVPGDASGKYSGVIGVARQARILVTTNQVFDSSAAAVERLKEVVAAAKRYQLTE